MSIAFVFATAHFVIELDKFKTGPFSQNGFIRSLDLKSLDLKFRTRGVISGKDKNVAVIGIDEKSLDRYGLWPWNRRIVAELVDKLNAGGAMVIAFDAVFADQDRNSSYVSVKRFLTAYDENALTPESASSKQLVDDLKLAASAQVELKSAIADLETRAKETPNARQVLAAVTKLKQQNERSNKALAKANELTADLTARSGKFYELMNSEISAVSPDEALAEAIKRAQDKAVLGYFFANKSQLKDVRTDLLSEGAKQLEPSAVRTFFDIVYYDQADQKPVPGIRKIEPTWGRLLRKNSSRIPRPNLPKIGQYAKAFGHFNVDGDKDGTVRRIEMFDNYDKGLYPALSLAAAARYYGEEIFPFDGVTAGETFSTIQIGPDKDAPEIPVTSSGEMLINWYGNPESYIDTYSAADILDGTTPAEAYKGRIVIIGLTAIGTFDFRVMPYGTIPGVYVHAAAAQNIIDGKYLIRQDDVIPIELLAYLVLGLIMGIVLPRIPAWASIIGMLTFGVALYAADVALIFSRGFWVLNVLPTLQVSLTTVSVIAYKFLTEGREKRQIRRAFQHYLNKTVVDMVIKDPSRLKLGGERRECTVFFSDVRGFTTLSEKLAPEQLVHVLNTYLTPMTDLIFKYDGTLDKYIGDAIMAFFNAPIDQPDHAVRACHVSVDMMEELGRLQKAWTLEGMHETIDIGIGLNSGPMVVGNMGTPNYFNYTAMGDTVNLGSRLEGINKEYGTNIIISQSTYNLAQQSVHVREMDLVAVKGKKQPVHIYELVGKGRASGTPKDLIEQWTRALELYRGQKWDEATDLFEMIRRDVKPNDGPCATYLDRCKLLRAA
ncbi:MAG: adenylate/guanylate cyclase domain-containing protein, partial [Clostridia bacterium]|nr:adenylate/guanylate cyclase domain-containing protein [Deltaproteobacteria bacterium]